MRVISRKALRDFWQTHPNAEQPLRAWYEEARTAAWHTPADIKAQYRTASLLGCNRVVFNIAGNKFRLIAAIHYNRRMIFAMMILTHAEYGTEKWKARL